MQAMARKDHHIERRNTISDYIRILGDNPIISAEEEKYIFTRMRQIEAENRQSNGARVEYNDLRDRVARGYQRPVIKYVCDFNPAYGEFMDMLQYANIGLTRAIQRFNPKKGAKFTTYLRRCVWNNIMRGLELKKKKKRLFILSLDEKLSAESENTHLNIFSAKSDSPADIAIREEGRMIVRKAVRRLRARERYVLERRYGLNGAQMTLASIGRAMKLSGTMIGVIQRQAEKKLAEELAELRFN